MVSKSVTAAQLLRLLSRRSGDDKGSAGMCCSSDVGQPVSHSAEGRCSTVRSRQASKGSPHERAQWTDHEFFEIQHCYVVP
ncbi:unnamed protein product [Boreogadus saida]